MANKSAVKRIRVEKKTRRRRFNAAALQVQRAAVVRVPKLFTIRY